jgi:hypothetical protein
MNCYIFINKNTISNIIIQTIAKVIVRHLPPLFLKHWGQSLPSFAEIFTVELIVVVIFGRRSFLAV